MPALGAFSSSAPPVAGVTVLAEDAASTGLPLCQKEDDVETVVPALNSGPDTQGSQWFIISGDYGAALPAKYTLFGEVDQIHSDTSGREKPGEMGDQGLLEALFGCQAQLLDLACGPPDYQFLQDQASKAFHARHFIVTATINRFH